MSSDKPNSSEAKEKISTSEMFEKRAGHHIDLESSQPVSLKKPSMSRINAPSKVDPGYAEAMKKLADIPSQRPFITKQDAAIVQASDRLSGEDTGKASAAAKVQSIADRYPHNWNKVE